MSRGNLESPAPLVSSVTEVRMLSEAQQRMRAALRLLMKMEQDLQVARKIQLSAFPRHLPLLDGFEIAAWNEPAEETGGDTYDIIGCRNESGGKSITKEAVAADRAIMLLADATGHGIGPALSATQIRAMLRMAVRLQQDLLKIARHMNEQLCADLPDGRFITAWLAELNVADRTLTSFSAGQGPILHYHAASDRFDVLGADAMPLGLVEELAIELTEPFRMSPGDIVAVISDGVYEAMDSTEAEFGNERVMQILSTHRHESAQHILAALQDSVAQFTDSAPAADDRTAIIIKCTQR
jgi:phosphoserine phosphatase